MNPYEVKTEWGFVFLGNDENEKGDRRSPFLYSIQARLILFGIKEFFNL